jgi:hypothetical protein
MRMAEDPAARPRCAPLGVPESLGMKTWPDVDWEKSQARIWNSVSSVTRTDS